MLDLVRQECLDRWAAWFPGDTSRPGQIATLVNRRMGHPRATYVVFDEGSSTPAVFVKVEGATGAASPLRDEAHVLSELESTGFDRTCRVPRSLHFAATNGVSSLYTSAVRGSSLAVPFHARFARAPAIARWLRCQRDAAAMSSRLPAGDSERRQVSDLVEGLGETFDSGDGPGSTELRELRARLKDRPIPYVSGWQHGDLAEGNVLVSRDGIGLVDWELASPSLEPWFDLCYLVAVTRFGRSTAPEPRWLKQLVRDVVRPHWVFDLHLRDATALTALRVAERNISRGRGSVDAWHDVARWSLASRVLQEPDR